MNDLEKLTDDQLIDLFKNNKIDKELKNLIIIEIDRRDLEKIEPTSIGLTLWKKLLIIVTSGFSFHYHIKETNFLLTNGKNKEYKQYWNYFLIGIGLNIILLLNIARYVIKPHFYK